MEVDWRASNRSSASTQPRFDGYCNRCGAYGHMKKFCCVNLDRRTVMNFDIGGRENDEDPGKSASQVCLSSVWEQGGHGDQVMTIFEEPEDNFLAEYSTTLFWAVWPIIAKWIRRNYLAMSVQRRIDERTMYVLHQSFWSFYNWRWREEPSTSEERRFSES